MTMMVLVVAAIVMVDNDSMINIWLVLEKVKAFKIIQYQVDHTYTLKYRLILEW